MSRWPYQFSLSELMQRAAEQDAMHKAKELGRLHAHQAGKPRAQKPKPRKPRKRPREMQPRCVWCGAVVAEEMPVCAHCADLEDPYA